MTHHRVSHVLYGFTFSTNLFVYESVSLSNEVVAYLRNKGRNPSFSFDSSDTITSDGLFRPCIHLSFHRLSKRGAIGRAVEHAWDTYSTSAWGYDKFLPLTQQGRSKFATGLGTIIADSLSTTHLIAGLNGRIKAARKLVETFLDLLKAGRVFVFKAVSRILGWLPKECSQISPTLRFNALCSNVWSYPCSWLREKSRSLGCITTFIIILFSATPPFVRELSKISDTTLRNEMFFYKYRTISSRKLAGIILHASVGTGVLNVFIYSLFHIFSNV